MNRRYEMVYIFESSLEEPQINEHLDRFHKLLVNKENPDPIESASHWGKRTLAYPIRHNEVGHYVVVQFSTDPELLPEFERAVKLEDSVIRYLLVLHEAAMPAPAAASVGGGAADDDEDDDVIAPTDSDE